MKTLSHSILTFLVSLLFCSFAQAQMPPMGYSTPAPTASPMGYFTPSSTPAPVSSATPGPDVAPPVAPPPVAPPPPAPPAQKRCCVCEYMANAACYGRKSELDCKKSAPGCIWHNEICTNSFKLYCDKWAAERTASGECDTIDFVEADIYGPDRLHYRGLENLDLTDCTALRYHWAGHADGCEDLIDTVAVCLDRTSSLCTDFKIDSMGCKTFPDIPRATEYIQSIVRLLGGDQMVTVTANQCTNFGLADLTCVKYATPLIYYVNSKGATFEPGRACQWGEQCFVPGQNSQCNTESGVSIQLCCCEKPGPDGRYDTEDDIIGSTCKWEKVPKCNHPALPVESPTGPPNLCHTSAAATFESCLSAGCSGIDMTNCFCTHCGNGNYCKTDGDCATGMSCKNFYCVPPEWH